MRIYVPATEGREPFTVDDVKDIVSAVSLDTYDGNLVIVTAVEAGTNNISLKVSVKDKEGPGARVVNGVRYAVACWHVYQDILGELYARRPAARVTTGVAKYLSAEHFEASYDSTGNRPLDAQHPHLRVAEACDCERVAP